MYQYFEYDIIVTASNNEKRQKNKYLQMYEINFLLNIHELYFWKKTP